jgi:hypothetical protein
MNTKDILALCDLADKLDAKTYDALCEENLTEKQFVEKLQKLVAGHAKTEAP